MNKFIANIFGAILSISHVLFILLLGYIIYLALKGDNIKILTNYGINPENSIGIVFLVFILYVLFAGFLSTFVSIHEQLISIRKEIQGLQNFN